MKKGFTLIEIIICIALIAILGTSSFFFFNHKNSQNLESIEEEILTAANLYLTVEYDDNGNNFLNGINNGGRGLILPLTKLVEKGYLSDKTVNTIEKEYSINEHHVLALLGDGTLNNDCSGVTLTISWDEEYTKEVYLCPALNNPTSKGDIILSVMNDKRCLDSSSTSGWFSYIWEDEREGDVYDFILPGKSFCQNSDYWYFEDYLTGETYEPGDTIFIDKSTILGVVAEFPSLIDVVEAAGIGRNSYYPANSTNNYIQFAGNVWRIIGQGSEGIKILMNDNIGYSKFNETTGVKSIAYEYYDSNVHFNRTEFNDLENTPGFNFMYSLDGPRVSPPTTFDNNTGTFTFDSVTGIKDGPYLLPYSTYHTKNKNHKYVIFKLTQTSVFKVVPEVAVPAQNKEGSKNPSTIKIKLDNFYDTYLSAYSDQIVSTNYCNDTSGYTQLYYSSKKTLNYETCYNNIGLGGKILSSIGLLTLNDVINLGATYQGGESFLNVSYDYWTMTPAFLSRDTTDAGTWNSHELRRDTNTMFAILNTQPNFYKEIKKNSLVQVSTSSSLAIRPVIVLQKYISVIKGDGSKYNPYIIEG